MTGFPAATDLGDFAERGRFLVAPITAFFDEILVMADDEKIRTTRLGLLATIFSVAPEGIDWAAVDALVS